MRSAAALALLVAVGATVLRFAVLFVVTLTATVAGVASFGVGVIGNVAVCLLAFGLLVRYGWLRRTGLLRGAPSIAAVWWLMPLVLEATTWWWWSGGSGWMWRAEGVLWWVVALLLASLGEELISRGFVLERLSLAWRDGAAAAFTGAVFGLAHLSQFALTDRGVEDVLGNVLLSGAAGFAYAAYQVRHHWVLPLVAVHAGSNFVTLHAPHIPPDWVLVLTHAGLVAYGVVLLRTGRR